MAGEWLRDPRVQAGDRERGLVVDVLRDASRRGQLSVIEFDRRWERLRAAHTVGDLVPLVEDLPNVPPPAERTSGRRRLVEQPAEPALFDLRDGSGTDRSDSLAAPNSAGVDSAEHRPWADPVADFNQSPGGHQTGARRAVTAADTAPPGGVRQGGTRFLEEHAPQWPGADATTDPTSQVTSPVREARSEQSPSAQRSTSGRSDTAEEWNISLRACAGSFALLVVSLLLAIVLG